MQTNKEAHMEDINRAVVALFNSLGEAGIINTDDPKHDKLFEELSACLEKYFNYPDYCNYN